MMRWKFSLRALFVITTISAVFFAFAAVYPRLAIECAVMTIPYVGGGAMLLVMWRSPLLARIVMALLGTLLLAACGLTAYLAYADPRHFEMSSIFFLLPFAIVCYALTWMIPNKRRQSSVKTADSVAPSDAGD